MWQKRNPGSRAESSPVTSARPTTYVRSPHHVMVLLNQDRIDALPVAAYESSTGYVRAIEFTVDASSREAACEVAYAITNSFPTQLHCEAKYLDIVTTYREIGHFRSVSVEVIFEVDGERFVCARFGFRVAA